MYVWCVVHVVCDPPLPEVVLEAAIQAIRDGYNIYTRLDGVAVMEHAMATFIVLASFTDQGVRNVKETIGRAETFKEMAKKGGVAVKDLY